MFSIRITPLSISQLKITPHYLFLSDFILLVSLADQVSYSELAIPFLSFLLYLVERRTCGNLLDLIKEFQFIKYSLFLKPKYNLLYLLLFTHCKTNFMI